MSWFKILLAFVVVFLFIFAPRINFVGGLSGGMIAVLCIFAAAMFYRRAFSLPRPLVYVLFAYTSFALYSAALAEVYANDPSYFINICVAVTISIFFSWFFAEVLAKQGMASDRLLYFVITLSVTAIFVNSLIVVLEYFLPSFKEFLEAMLVQEASANIDYAAHAFRFRGFSSSGGAGLSIVNALGVLITTFLVLRKRLPAPIGVIFSIVMVVSNIFTGRTGLIFGIVFLLVLLGSLFIRSIRSGVKGFIGALALVLSVILISRFAFNFELDPEVANWAFEWVDGLMSGQVSSTSSDDLGTMLFLPDDAMHLLFGIGFFEGNSPLYPRSDSGYVKTVLTIGVLGGFLFYGIIAYIFLALQKYQKNFYLLVVPVLLYMFFVEIKEPFLYQNFAARVIFLFSGAAMYLLNQYSNARSSYNSRA